MTTIGGVTGRPESRPSRPAGSAATSAFSLPDGAPACAADQAAPAGGVAMLPLGTMLAAEALEQLADRNAAARRQGQAVMARLAALQHALLAERDRTALLAQLAGLVADMPAATDPGLAALLGEIALRARVELARHGR
jgi:hypothetical protein